MQSPDIQETPTPYQVKPLWSPLMLSWVTLLFTPIPAVFLAAFNFGRLGEKKKQKMWLFYGGISTIIICIFLFRVGFMPDIEWRWFRPFSSVLSIFIAWRIYLSQQNSFVRHIEQGGKKASFWGPLLISILWFTIIIGVCVSAAMVLEVKIGRDFDKARALMDKGQRKEAEAIFKTLKRDSPEDTATKINLAIIYAETERIDLAKQELKEVLKLEPENKEVRDYLKELQAP